MKKLVSGVITFGISVAFFSYLLSSSYVYATAYPSKWFGSYVMAPSTSVVNYAPPFGAASSFTTEVSSHGIIPSSGTVRELHVKVDTAPGAGKSYTIALSQELSATALTCQISDSNTTCNDTSNSISVTAGERLSIKITPSGTPAAARMAFNLEFLPTTEGETVLMGSSSGSLLTGTRYLPLLGANNGGTSEGVRHIVMPAAGTLKKLYVRLSATPGTDNARTFTLRKNAADVSGISIAYGATDSGTLSDTDTITVAAGDLISLSSLETGTPAAASIGYGIVFVPDTTGDFIIPTNNNGNISASAARYVGLSEFSTVTAPSATETEVQTLGWSDFIIKAAYVKLSFAPGASKSITTVLRENAADPSVPFTVAISGSSATTGSASGSFTPTDGALYATSITPSGTPTVGGAAVSYLGNSIVDTTAPTPGNSGTITTSSVTTTSMSLAWTKATDDVSAQGTLQYEVRRSTSNNIDSVANAEANGTIVCAYATDVSTCNATGLSASTTYYFNVIVKDEVGNKAVYTTKSQATADPDITAPVISSISTTASYTTATTTWTTDESADTQIDYGLTVSYTASTTLDSALVTSHSQTFTGLRAGTTYHYRVRSTDASGNLATSSDQTFTTTSFGGTTPVVDVYIDFEAGTAPEAMTSAILTSGTHGSSGTWSTSTPYTAGSVSTSTSAEYTLPVPVQVTSGGTTYSDSGTRGLAYDQTVINQNAIYTFTSNYASMTVSGFANFNSVEDPGNNQLWDHLSFTDGTGQSAVLQQRNTTNVFTVYTHVSSTPGGSTAGSAITITRGQTYWFSMKWDKPSLTVSLSVYNPTDWSLVGTSSDVIYDSGGNDGTVNTLMFGEDHSLTSSTYQYFDDIFVDYTNARYPMVPDVHPPTSSLTAPASGATVSGTSVTVSASASDNVGVSGVQFKLDSTTNIGSEDTSAPYSITWDSTSASNGSYTLTAVGRDATGNQTTSSAVTVTVSNDVTAPVLSSGSPSTEQTAGTTSITLSLTTNENATCKYGTTASTAYASITSTFTTTGTTSHSSTITGLLNGNSYNYYVRCTDGSNPNTSDYTISFSIAPSPVSSSSSISTRVENLLAMGNIQAAQELIRQHPALYQPVVIPGCGERTSGFSAATGQSCILNLPSKPANSNPLTYMTSLSTATLRQGSRGESVTELQRFLNQFLIVKLIPDGIFGPATRAAVILFQKANGLVPDGIVGPKTRGKMG